MTDILQKPPKMLFRGLAFIMAVLFQQFLGAFVAFVATVTNGVQGRSPCIALPIGGERGYSTTPFCFSSSLALSTESTPVGFLIGANS